MAITDQVSVLRGPSETIGPRANDIYLVAVASNTKVTVLVTRKHELPPGIHVSLDGKTFLQQHGVYDGRYRGDPHVLRFRASPLDAWHVLVISRDQSTATLEEIALARTSSPGEIVTHPIVSARRPYGLWQVMGTNESILVTCDAQSDAPRWARYPRLFVITGDIGKLEVSNIKKLEITHDEHDTHSTSSLTTTKGTLRLFGPPDARTPSPLWKVNATERSLVAITDGVVVVETPEGIELTPMASSINRGPGHAPKATLDRGL